MSRISVVTICMENPKELALTCQSVSRQTIRPRRHIVVDSSSSENQEVMRSIAESNGAAYYWLEPSGTYGAMARGLEELAQHDYVIFLNATDRFAGKRTIELAERCLHLLENDGANVVWGIGKTVVSDQRVPYFLRFAGSGEKMWRMLSRGSVGIAHPSMVALVWPIRDSGIFERRWEVSLDYELSLELGKKYGPPALFPFAVSYYDQNGGSGQKPFITLVSKSKARFRVLGIRGTLAVAPSLLWAALRFLIRKGPSGSITRTLGALLGWERLALEPNEHFCSMRIDKDFPDCCDQALINLPA